MDIRICNVCGVSSDINKFKIWNNKICAKKCLKCTSKKNNQVLKDKQYYTKYYKEHINEFTERTSKQYAPIKEANRLKKLEKLAKIEKEKLEKLAKIEKEKLDQEIKPKIRRTRKIKQHIEPTI
jgi:mevalonate kinase